MTQDPTMPLEEAPPEAPDEAPREAEIERLTTLHAERVRELEADRWRLNERIESLESQNAELQANFIEQTRNLSSQLQSTKETIREEQKQRLKDAVDAQRREGDSVASARAETLVEAQRQAERAEQLLGQLLQAKDALLAQAAQHHRENLEHRDATNRQLADLRKELGSELASRSQQLEDTLSQLLRSKEEMLALQLRQTEALESLHAARLADEVAHRAELLRRDELADQRLNALRAQLTAQLEEVRARSSETTTVELRLEHAVREREAAMRQAEQAERALADLMHEARAEKTKRAATEQTASAAAHSEVESMRQTVAKLQGELQHQRRVTSTLEGKVEQTKDTLSFRLGYLLIHAPKSWEAMRRLPTELLELNAEAKRRRDFRRQGRTAILDERRTPPFHAIAAVPPSVDTGTSRSHASPRQGSAHFVDEAMRLLVSEGVEAATRFAHFAASDAHERAAALTQLAKALKSTDLPAASELAQRAYEAEPLAFRAKWLAFCKFEAGEIREPAALLEGLPPGFALKPSEKARVAEIGGLRRVQAQLPAIPVRQPPNYEPLPQSALYVAASALPFHISGYTVRTQSLLQALVDAGFSVTAALRPGYPTDRGVDLPRDTRHHLLGGVRYLHLDGPHVRRTALDDFVSQAAAAIEQCARRVRPQVIHAASNHVNALPALIAARRLGVPFVYEVRGMWELTAATRRPNWEASERFQLEHALETLVAQNADLVFTLTQAMVDDLASRGVPRERLDVLHNAVDPTIFAPRRKDPGLMLRFGLNASSFTLVYAGSLLFYEGVDDLVRAVAALVREGIDATLVLAGDGEAQDGIQELARTLGIERRVKLLGKLPPSEVPGLWSVADAAAFPRKPFRVCQLVSPLKPLEPMAMGIPVVVSDVSAMRELVEDERTGLIHDSGDPVSLAARLRRLALDPALRQTLGQAAREVILSRRTWSASAQHLLRGYGKLCAPPEVDVVALAPGRSSMTSEDKASFEAKLDQAFQQGGAAAVRNLAQRQAFGRSERLLAFCLLKAATCCQRSNDSEAAALAQEALEADGSAGTLRGAARVIYGLGDVESAARIVDRLEGVLGTLSGKDDDLAREVRARRQLLTSVSMPKTSPQLQPMAGKSVYFLHFSLPYTSVGYATRSHGLIAGIRATGYDVRPYTRCGFPLDFKPELEGSDVPRSDTIDGIEYRRLLEGGRRGSTESEYLLNCAKAYEDVIRDERPEIVHAASNYATALPALIAARRMGLPFIYEIRGFWEITRSSRDNDFENSARYALMRHFEALVAKEADHVFTLTSAMREELVRRGIDFNKVTLVHNGVDIERFLPRPRDRTLADSLNLPPDVPVIGYVGSFVDYEGLDDLVRAAAMLTRRGQNFRMLLVGDGAVMPELRELVRQEGVQDRVLLTGRVPHDQVASYYSLIDICPFPRKPWEVCEMVSPLKPFEAMAMGKAVVVSSTHALREIVRDGVNGLVFDKGDPSSLSVALERLITDPKLRERVEIDGREWVSQHRTWREGGRVVVEGYRSVLDGLAQPNTGRVTA